MKRRTALGGLATAPLGLALARAAHAADDVHVGVSGPFSGDDADYGRVWRLGMDLAVDRINRGGGLRGRRLVLDYEDTQSDPKQSIVVAEKFVADRRIVAELGDFSSAASIAASPIYQRAKLVQFGFTNSAPAFTRGGDFMWSTARTTDADSALIAQITTARFGKRQAIAYQDTAWGSSAAHAYADDVKTRGGTVVAFEGYLENTREFRALLSKIRGAGPDVFVLFAYYTDGALLLSQAADVGLEAKVVTTGACYNRQFIELGGDAVEGVVLPVEFFVDEPRPEVRRFVDAYTRRYHEAPDLFAAYAYDAVEILAWAAVRGNFERVGLRDALAHGREIPSVVNGPFRFGADRRVVDQRAILLTIRDHAFHLLS